MVTIATNMAGRGTDIVLGGNIDSDKENRKKIIIMLLKKVDSI